ncbi:sorbitol dehydrogenase [Acetobacter sp. LMG 1627]|uniref:Sorbitol dehydrogenase n=2 Tax=Acetobacter conturbans TaxID=1737472 RepID=A0ABX0K361_9PROT|nr:sorbitol dehydrogenase [Acetobacter conturbans]
MSRRDVLLSGMGAALAGSAAEAGEPDAQNGALAATDPLVQQFMVLSQRLTDRDALDARIGAALCMGIVQSGAERKTQLQALHTVLTKEQYASASDFARAAEKQDAALKDVIHEIMTGWYRGVANGKVVVYRSALMFDLTKDAVFPKTYAAGGPFYWTSKPPEVAKPNGLPALSPSKFVVEPT